MNKFPFPLLIFIAGNTVSQNIPQQQNLGNYLNNAGYVVRIQSNQMVQTLASNVSLRPNKVKINNQVIINTRRASNNSHHQAVNRAKVNTAGNNMEDNSGAQADPVNQQPLVMNDFHIQTNKVQVLQVSASAENQSSPSGIGNENKEGLGLKLKLPEINFKPIKFSSKSSSVSHKSFRFKTFFTRLNYKTKGKLSFAKRMKIKVDNCFKW